MLRPPIWVVISSHAMFGVPYPRRRTALPKFCACLCVHPWEGIWRSEEYVRCLPLTISTLSFTSGLSLNLELAIWYRLEANKSQQSSFPHPALELQVWLSFLFVWMFCLPVCKYTTCVQWPQRPEEGIKSPRTRVMDGCRSLCGC